MVSILQIRSESKIRGEWQSAWRCYIIGKRVSLATGNIVKRIACLWVAVLSSLVGLAAGCNAPAAEFQLSNLQISPDTVEIYEQVTISVDVKNVGNADGSYLVNCSMGNGLESFVQQVTLEPGEVCTITFNHTPSLEGKYTILVGSLSRTLSVTAPLEGMWRIPYRVVGGEITMGFSLVGLTPVVNTVDFPGATFDMYVSKAVVNGSREIYIDSDSFISEPVIIEGIITGIDMEMLFTLREDAVGLLYVGEGIGDVDVLSVDTDGSLETQFGDSLMDAPGSALMFSPSEGQSFVSVGQSFIVPMDVYSTTGFSSNEVVVPGRKMNGSVMECLGVPFAEEGGIAPYVGTEATLVSTGSSLDRRFTGFGVDFQFMTVMQIEPNE
jgi:hypothetical protein